ncbi:MAG: thiol-disulfide oxidoreductase DCC family protein [Phycisphaerales bacterium]
MTSCSAAGRARTLPWPLRGRVRHPPGPEADPGSIIAASPTIVLFDGTCKLCSGMVRFVAERDRSGSIGFAALQSDAARDACATAGHALSGADDPESIIVIADGRVLERSDAVLEIASRLRFPWPMLGAFRVVPRALRDALYGFLARRRHRWFGRCEACMVPTSELRARFID